MSRRLLAAALIALLGGVFEVASYHAATSYGRVGMHALAALAWALATVVAFAKVFRTRRSAR